MFRVTAFIKGLLTPILQETVNYVNASVIAKERGINVVVFEQNIRPYGKIEDGLPKWHVKLQIQENLHLCKLIY